MQATKVNFIEFLSSNVWKDIKHIVALRLSECRDMLEGGVDADIGRIRVEQGRAEELRYILSLPDSIVEEWETLNEEEVTQ